MSNQALAIVGSSRRNGERELFDFYPTPSYVTKRLLDFETFQGTTWEPACGDGAISKTLEEIGMSVISTDLVYRGYGEGELNFFTQSRIVENIITNPPFNRAQEFIDHSKKNATKKIAMFLKTTFLEGIGRYSMFKDKSFPLKTMYQFCKRVSLQKNGDDLIGKSGMIAFAWFVWDKSHVGSPTIEWIV